MASFIRVVAALLASLVGCGAACAREASLVSITTARGAKQAFILIRPERPLASAILFAGGHGALGLEGNASMRWGAKNFLVRTREAFAAHDLMVAVIDAPSDKQGGMNAIFRMSSAHVGDIDAVAAYLKRQAPVPVWLIGTSMGTFSAAAGAIGAKNIDGLVLTSTVTRAMSHWWIAGSHADGVASMPLQRITVPTLIVSHARDGCAITPAADAAKLRARLTRAKHVATVLLDGGDPPRSAPCQAMSQHGFLGIEGKAVNAIAGFILANVR